MGRVRLILTLSLVYFLAGVGSAFAGSVYVLEIREPIQPIVAQYVARGFDLAESAGASLVLIELDTPGGLVDSTREITSRILEAKVPVACYVSPGGARAASAGFVILISADIAAMAPTTNAGAAHPVLTIGSGEDSEQSKIMNRKVENDLAAMVRSLAKTRGRGVEAAEKAVRESQSYTDSEARDAKLIDLVALDRSDLLGRLEGREIHRRDGQVVRLTLKGAVIPVEMLPAERFLARLLSPEMAVLLLLAGIVGLAIEITHPGGILPGVAGAIALLLSLYALAALPINYVGVALILLAVGLIIAEIKVTSHGILGVGGAVAMVLGGTLLIDAPIPEMRIDPMVFIPSAALLAGTLAALSIRAAAIQRRPPISGREGMIGLVGTALTALAPSGKVFVDGAYWDAQSDLPVAEGARVEVVAINGLALRVRPAA